jgi:hypothetical protein
MTDDDESEPVLGAVSPKTYETIVAKVEELAAVCAKYGGWPTDWLRETLLFSEEPDAFMGRMRSSTMWGSAGSVLDTAPPDPDSDGVLLEWRLGLARCQVLMAEVAELLGREDLVVVAAALRRGALDFAERRPNPRVS